MLQSTLQNGGAESKDFEILVTELLYLAQPERIAQSFKLDRILDGLDDDLYSSQTAKPSPPLRQSVVTYEDEEFFTPVQEYDPDSH